LMLMISDGATAPDTPDGQSQDPCAAMEAVVANGIDLTTVVGKPTGCTIDPYREIEANITNSIIEGYFNISFNDKYEENCDLLSVYTPFNGAYSRQDTTMYGKPSYKSASNYIGYYDGESWTFAHFRVGIMSELSSSDGLTFPTTSQNWTYMKLDGVRTTYYNVPIECSFEYAPSLSPTYAPSISPSTSDPTTSMPSVAPHCEIDSIQVNGCSSPTDIPNFHGWFTLNHTYRDRPVWVNAIGDSLLFLNTWTFLGADRTYLMSANTVFDDELLYPSDYESAFMDTTWTYLDNNGVSITCEELEIELACSTSPTTSPSTSDPTTTPSGYPTSKQPSKYPTSEEPSSTPTAYPTSDEPSVSPTSDTPSISPTSDSPSLSPTSDMPTQAPSPTCEYLTVGDVCKNTTYLDLVFLFDLSTSMDTSIYDDFVDDLLSLDLADARVAVVGFSTDVNVLMTFDQPASDAIEVINSMALSSNGGSTFASYALQRAYADIWMDAVEETEIRYRAAILVSDGNFAPGQDPCDMISTTYANADIDVAIVITDPSAAQTCTAENVIPEIANLDTLWHAAFMEDCDWHTVWTPFNGVYQRTSDGLFLEFEHMGTGAALVHDDETWTFSNDELHTMTKRGEGLPPHPPNLHDWLWTNGDAFEWYEEVPIICAKDRIPTPKPSYHPSRTPSKTPSKTPSSTPTMPPTTMQPSLSPSCENEQCYVCDHEPDSLFEGWYEKTDDIINEHPVWQSGDGSGNSLSYSETWLFQSLSGDIMQALLPNDMAHPTDGSDYAFQSAAGAFAQISELCFQCSCTTLPTELPTTESPSSSPSLSPSSEDPTKSPSSNPTTDQPSTAPTTETPTKTPSVIPSISPTFAPTDDCPHFLFGIDCRVIPANDLLILVDISLNEELFEEFKAALETYIDDMPVESRLAVVQFSTIAKLSIPLQGKQYGLKQKVRDLDFLAGSSWTDRAMQMAYSEVWEGRLSDERNAMTLMIFDSSPAFNQDPCDTIKMYLENDIDIFAANVNWDNNLLCPDCFPGSSYGTSTTYLATYDAYPGATYYEYDRDPSEALSRIPGSESATQSIGDLLSQELRNCEYYTIDTPFNGGYSRVFDESGNMTMVNGYPTYAHGTDNHFFLYDGESWMVTGNIGMMAEIGNSGLPWFPEHNQNWTYMSFTGTFARYDLVPVVCVNTTSPTPFPSSIPSRTPSNSPSTLPSYGPSMSPSGSPTSSIPSSQPSVSPTKAPTTCERYVDDLEDIIGDMNSEIEQLQNCCSTTTPTPDVSYYAAYEEDPVFGFATCRDDDEAMAAVNAAIGDGISGGCKTITELAWRLKAGSTSPCNVALAELDASLTSYCAFIGEICPDTCDWDTLDSSQQCPTTNGYGVASEKVNSLVSQFEQSEDQVTTLEIENDELTSTVSGMREELADKTSENVQLTFDFVTCNSEKAEVEDDLAACQTALSLGSQAIDESLVHDGSSTCSKYENEIIALRSEAVLMKTSVNELGAEVERFQEIENINQGCQDLTRILEQDSITSWRNAVENGGLACSFVPQEACSSMASCMVQDARCVNNL